MVSSISEILPFFSYIFCWWCLHLQFLICFLGFSFPCLPLFVFVLLFLHSLFRFWTASFISFTCFIVIWLCFLHSFKGFICFLLKWFYLCTFVFLYFFQWVIYILLKGLCYLHEIGLLGQLPSCLCAEELLGCCQAMVSSGQRTSRQSAPAEVASWKSVRKKENISLNQVQGPERLLNPLYWEKYRSFSSHNNHDVENTWQEGPAPKIVISISADVTEHLSDSLRRTPWNITRTNHAGHAHIAAVLWWDMIGGSGHICLY